MRQPVTNPDFLLLTDTARKLYHEVAEHMPIVDYHCHLEPREIYENRTYENITQLWLGGDHYKWRLMRSNGVEERFITGDAPDREKFQKFAEALPRAIGNPMYHWCHLELAQYFGYHGILSPKTAQEVWELTSEKLQSMSARQLIAASNVAMIGTTDDPLSDLGWHKKLAEDNSFSTVVCPTFRPDPALSPEKPGFAAYMARLGEAAGVNISTVEDIREALSRRMAHFAALGCRASDHGLNYIMFRPVSDEAATAALQKALNGQTLTAEEREGYQTALLLHCAREYARLGWAMQIHFSCMRNPNEKMFRALGPDTGFDAMAVTDSCTAAYRLFSALDAENCLPKTILYSLNPADNAWIDTLLGSFQSAELPGKIQHGSAWWFNDHRAGMTEHLVSLANLSVLGNFIGMLTDSRSFLSYTRHSYFRRILCDLLGQWVENGEYPDDPDALQKLVEDICYYNAKRYFNL